VSQDAGEKNYPRPGSQEAAAQGCTCDTDQSNPNWLMVNPKCPVHGRIDYVLWQAQQGKGRKKGR
jgi:hypothetical protein